MQALLDDLKSMEMVGEHFSKKQCVVVSDHIMELQPASFRGEGIQVRDPNEFGVYSGSLSDNLTKICYFYCGLVLYHLHFGALIKDEGHLCRTHPWEDPKIPIAAGNVPRSVAQLFHFILSSVAKRLKSLIVSHVLINEFLECVESLLSLMFVCLQLGPGSCGRDR